METVHGPKLASLVGELLKPLDLGTVKLFELSTCFCLTVCDVPSA